MAAQLLDRPRRRGGRRVPLYAQDWKYSPPVLRWRSRIAPNTFPTFYSHLWRFLTHIHKSPEQVVVWGKIAEDPFEILDAIQGYVSGLEAGLRYKTRFDAYVAIRSFFTHNRIMLPNDPSFQIRSDTPPVVRRISIENLHELIGLAAQPLRSMLLVKWMALTDTEGLIYINNHFADQISQAIKEGKTIVRLEMPGRKSKRNIKLHYTFIGRDALQSLKEYFDRQRGWPKPAEPIWVSEQTREAYTKTAFNQAW